MHDPFEMMMDGLFGQPMHQQRRRESPRASAENIFEQLFSRMGHSEDAQSQASTGCSEEYIASLPEKNATKEDTCYICLEPCKEGKDSVELPCKHAFDRDCLSTWLKDHDSCPVCRAQLDQGRERP